MQRFALPLLLAFSLCACSTLNLSGKPKREVLVDRVRTASDSLKEAKETFVTALQTFDSVTRMRTGPFDEAYQRLTAELRRGEQSAGAVRRRITSVDYAAQSLFKEWRTEIGRYARDDLRKRSQQKYDIVFERYEQVMSAVKTAEAQMEPVLSPMRDQVLFLKHNLNAEALASVKIELVGMERNVNALVREMEEAIVEADRFIKAMKTE